MNHNQHNTDATAIRRAYGQFIEKGVVPEGVVPDFIKRSWQRSVAFGVSYDRIREVGRIDETDLRVKCSCTIDRIASEIRYGEYVELWTAANAVSIGGERGAQLRDAQVSQDMAKKFRTIEAKAQKGCFLRKEE